MTGTPYPQVSQVSGTDLPVRKTRITAFSEDYHKPAAPLRHAAVQVDLRVVTWRAGLAHRQSIHILQHCRRKHTKAQMSDFNRWLQAHDPHAHLAYLTPNQHTLTCRSINDSVLKQPAYPQVEDILGSYPFLSPIERAYLGLCNTAGGEAKIPFHGSFITKVHLLGHQHMGTRGKHTRGGHRPFQYLNQIHTWDLTPRQPTILSISLVLSASLHVVGKVLCLPTFWRFLQEAWLNVSTNANFGWGPTAKEISNVDSALILHCMFMYPVGTWCRVICAALVYVGACTSSPMHPFEKGTWWSSPMVYASIGKMGMVLQSLLKCLVVSRPSLPVLLTIHLDAHC